MAINRHIEKPEVLNPLTTLHTVGQELEEALVSKGISPSAMGIANLSKKEKLTEKQMQRACALLDVGDFYIQVLKDAQNLYAERKEKFKAKYKEACSAFRRLKQIIPMLRNDFNSGYDKLDDILDFFDADSEKDIFEHVSRTGTLYRSQNQTEVDELNLSAWLRRGELDFEKVQTDIPPYNKESLQRWIDSYEWSEKVESPVYFRSIPKILYEFGVSVILIPYLSKTVYGAVEWKSGHPIVMVSDREQDLATCWFTLFHELGHVILHENELSIDGMINSNKVSERREKDANKFANKYLFFGDDLRKHIFELKKNNNFESQAEIADRYKVNPIFVGYWMRKAQYYPSHHKRIPIHFC